MESSGEAVRRRFTADEVMQMVRAGILGDEKVELIDGEILVMSPNDPPHASSVARLDRRLAGVYRNVASIRSQLTLDISPSRQPEPDIVVARGDEHTYDTRHPRGEDCILVVEVSWSSRARDLRKAKIYAAAGVPVYWILDVDLRRLTVHERPKPDGTYTHVRVLDAEDDVTPPETEVSWRIADLLPSST
jgi:Uma2 family endonuclease